MLLAGAVLLAIASCGNDPRMTYPNIYRNAGISFSYPDGWKVIRDETNTVRFIAVRSPATALFTVLLIPEEKAPTLEAFASQYDRLSGGSAAPAVGNSVFGSIERSAEYMHLVEHFTRMYQEKPVPYTRVYWRGYSGNAVLFITAESSEGEAPSASGKFDTILASLRYAGRR